MTTPTYTALEYAAMELRRERDRLLAESDWMVTKSVETGVPLSSQWAAYRQALRDLPSTATVQLNKYDHLDWAAVKWPQKPESV